MKSRHTGCYLFLRHPCCELLCLLLFLQTTQKTICPSHERLVCKPCCLLVWLRAKSLQSCPTLWDPMDCSPPGSSVHGILQARKLEWVIIPCSRGSSWPRKWTHLSYVSCIAGGFFTTSATWETPTPRYIYKRTENRDWNKMLHTNVHSSIFTVAKRWQQPKCPLTD